MSPAKAEFAYTTPPERSGAAADGDVGENAGPRTRVMLHATAPAAAVSLMMLVPAPFVAPTEIRPPDPSEIGRPVLAVGSPPGAHWARAGDTARQAASSRS